MIRKLTPQDKTDFLTLLDEFYHSPAVLHPVPAHFLNAPTSRRSRTALCGRLPPRAGGEARRLRQVSLTWSTEAGGMVVLLEELYLRPEFQGKGSNRA